MEYRQRIHLNGRGNCWAAKNSREVFGVEQRAYGFKNEGEAISTDGKIFHGAEVKS